MVRAHGVGADLSVSHLFSSFSNPTINSSSPAAEEAPQFLYAAPALSPRSQHPSSLLERRMAYYSSSLTSTQVQMDLVTRSFAESASNGSALAFVLGAGALARNVRLGFTIGEGAFAGLANMSARARITSGALGALALVGCGESSVIAPQARPLTVRVDVDIEFFAFYIYPSSDKKDPTDSINKGSSLWLANC